MGTETDRIAQGGPKRIGAIDTLRGLALIGVFLVNITAMGGPIEIEHPLSPASLADPDWKTFAASHLFIYGAMRGLFSLLFGASALLFLADPRRSTAQFLRRCFWLLMFGVVNSTLLLWPGDILNVYALAALVIAPMRRAPPSRLFALAAAILAALALWPFIPGLQGVDMPSAAGDATNALAAERAARLGGYASNLAFMTKTAIDWTFDPSMIWWVLDAAAFMLIGMALFRLDVLSGRRTLALYAGIAGLCLVIGLPIRFWETAVMLTDGGEAPPLAQALHQVGRLMMTLAWAGLFFVCWKTLPRRFFSPLSALGRMAFTGYLTQSVIGAVVFSGAGLGLWGRLSWPGMWALVLVSMAVMSVAFMLWLAHFRMGPLEWAWRALTFWGAPPLLRSDRPDHPAV